MVDTLRLLCLCDGWIDSEVDWRRNDSWWWGSSGGPVERVLISHSRNSKLYTGVIY